MQTIIFATKDMEKFLLDIVFIKEFFKSLFPHYLQQFFNNSHNHTIGPSGVRALPLAAGINEGGHYFGPSGVRPLPLAAGINVGGHYKWHFFLFPLSSFFLPAHC